MILAGVEDAGFDCSCYGAEEFEETGKLVMGAGWRLENLDFGLFGADHNIKTEGLWFFTFYVFVGEVVGSKLDVGLG